MVFRVFGSEGTNTSPCAFDRLVKVAHTTSIVPDDLVPLQEPPADQHLSKYSSHYAHVSVTAASPKVGGRVQLNFSC